MSKLNLKIILGSTRKGRFVEQPGMWIFNEAKKIRDFDVELLDLRDYPLPFFDEEIIPSHLADSESYYSDVVKAWTSKIAEADAFIIVTPEYNHSCTAVLKNALDYVYKEWNYKAISFVGYGSMGGARAVEHLRTIAVKLRMTPIREAVHISAFWTLLDTQGKLKTETFESQCLPMLIELGKVAYQLRSTR